MAAVTARRRRIADPDESAKDATGHYLLDGGRWHWPKMGDPTACGVPGCDRVLGQSKPTICPNGCTTETGCDCPEEVVDGE